MLEMTRAQFVDGLSLGPGYFGFTDPLTSTWRPKKFRVEDILLMMGLSGPTVI